MALGAVMVCALVLSASASSTLREAAAAHGLFIGAATNAGYLQNASEPRYKSVEQAQFSITTAENGCKVGPIHPEPDRYNWAQCDTVFHAAAAAKQLVRGHNLCWHSQNPNWLNSSLSHDQLVAALDSHISTVIGRYGANAYAWDVVNEAVSDTGSAIIKTEFPPWMPTVPDFIDRAFTLARKAAGPLGPKLFYNDYGIETLGTKSDKLYKMVQAMQQNGVPIDGIGFQTHVSMGFQVDSMRRNLERFAALALEVHITELDIRACDAHSVCDAAALKKQAELYAALLRMCMGLSQCKVFEMWGFTDRHTWITGFQNPTHKNEMPLPFDTEYGKKPAYHSMMEVLNQTSSWQTQTTMCRNTVAISGLLHVKSVVECEALCDADAKCVAVDTNGEDCYTKSACDGTVGGCQGWCSYKKVRPN